jgi:predicted PurR-regulated permease PerM
VNDGVAQRIFFGVLLVAVTIAFIWLVRGFLQPIFWAVALGIVFYPLHERICGLLNRRRSLGAALTVITIVLIVVIPLAVIVSAMTGEAAGLVERIQSGEINVPGAIEWVEQKLPRVSDALRSINIDPDRLQEQLSSGLSSGALTVSRIIAAQAVSIGQDTLRIGVYFFLMLYLLYFFMRDGTKILDGLVRALPFGDERERHLLERFAQVSRATIKGTLVVGIVQGTIGGILFAVLGIGAPVLWGVIMALLSIIPAVGPALVWLPAAVILIVKGQIVSGIVLIAAGTLVIGLADNVLRPILVGRDTRMPDYLILLSTLGGLTAFGLAGVVIGPIIAAFFLSVWEMAEEEYAHIDPSARGEAAAGGNGDLEHDSDEDRGRDSNR